MTTATAPLFTFDAQSHTYRLDDQVLPGVTTIIKTAGLSHPYDGFQEAQYRGNYAHTMTEYDDLGDLDESTLHPAYKGYLTAWRAFRADTGFVPELIEVQRYHPTYRFAGTIDRIGMLHGKRTLVDLKSGVPESWHPIQTAGYSLLEPVEARLAVYLKADGTYALTPHRDDADVRTFLAALTIALWRIAHERS